MWTTPSEMRRILGLKVEELSDMDATHWIEKAQVLVRADTGLLQQEVGLSGIIDGINKVFFVPKIPIGDKDFDLRVGTTDIEVYGYIDENDETTKVKLDVANVSPMTGRVELVTPPNTTFTVLKATYWHSWILESTEIIKLATALYAGYLYTLSEEAFIPVDLKIGSLSMGHAVRGATMFPYNRLWLEYIKIIAPLRTKLGMSEEMQPLEYPVRELI